MMEMIDKLLGHLTAQFDIAHGNLLRQSVLEPIAGELTVAQTQTNEALNQISVLTSNGEWIDFLGGYFAVPRFVDEADDTYRERIIAEVIKPRNNNIAIEKSIKDTFGIAATVVDRYGSGAGLMDVYYDGSLTYDGTSYYRSIWTGSDPNGLGLFDVFYDYDLTSEKDITQFTSGLRVFVERLRSAGTQLGTVSMTGTSLQDDAFPAPTDDADIFIHTAVYLDGSRLCDGSWVLSGDVVTSESLS